jgi:formamidopyrimidine-DNA glycosylase
MPELPEVEHLRRTLLGALPGRRVVAVTLHRPDICTSIGDGGRPVRPRRQHLLLGATIRDVLRHGKNLAVLVADGRTLGIHLGMSGQVLVVPPGRSPSRRTHIHATWRLDDGARLLFRDPRRFGGLWTFPSLDALRTARWAALGPDALTLTAPDLAAALAGSRRAVKAALLDQSAIAGVGNIYADEALFVARIRPQRPAAKLTPPEVLRLATAIRAVLEQATESGGSTLRDYVDAGGQAGRHQLAHAVYGRGGEACLVCGGGLRSTLVAQRTTVYCPRCQA